MPGTSCGPASTNAERADRRAEACTGVRQAIRVSTAGIRVIRVYGLRSPRSVISFGAPPAATGRGARLVRSLLAPAVLVALLGAGLDVAQWLRAPPLWVDEEMVALNFRDRAFADLPGALWLGQSAPLGWLVVQRAVLLGFGTGELVVRSVPLLFGLATLGAAAWIGRRWLHGVAGALLVALFAIAQWMSHYRFELKHYSADAFWALLLPAMAAWAGDAADAAVARRRWTRWWAVAALAQWTANGALLVTPGCAILLAVVILWRHGGRAALGFAFTGTLWLLSVGAHYALSLQYAHRSRHLRDYWGPYVLAEAEGIMETLAWYAARLEPLASHPGGTELTAAFWAAAVAGLAISRHRLLALMSASVPAAGFVLAGAGLVPLHDRIALWIAPALYTGIALLADAGLHYGRRAWSQRQWRLAAPGAAAVAAALYVGGDILATGAGHLDLGIPSDSNHALDDRAAVRWLLARRRAGDALISTRLGWPAIWWYGDIGLRRPPPGGRLPDGSRMWELTLERAHPQCRTDLREALAGHRRALLYVGFPDSPPDFFDEVLRELERLGTVVDSASFSAISRVAVVDLRPAGPDGEGSPPAAAADSGGGPDAACIGLRAARRW